MKYIMRLLLLTIALTFFLALFANFKVSAAFNANRIIDDPIFDNSGSMNAAQIDAWLNANFPNSCISTNSGFEARVPAGYSPSGGFIYGGFTSAGQVIATSAQVYGINPQVLLVTLEKEQSLVGGRNNFSGYCNNGDEHKYAAATGYGCPDGGTVYNWSSVSLYRRSGVERTVTGSTCVNSASKAGFSQQVIRAAWLLKFGEQRSKGNIGWAVVTGDWDNSDDPQSCYSGPMTQGTWRVCPSGSTTYYDGYRTIDGTAVHIDTGATAALYWYTPHFSGNQNFVALYESWFGSTIGDYCINNSPPPTSTNQLFHKYNRNVDTADFTIYSGTSTKCIESHVWNPGMQSWQAHIASNQPVVSYPDLQVLYGDLDGSGYDYPVLFGVQNTSTGKVEAHVWNRNMKSYLVHTATNQNAINPGDCKILLADLDATGKDDTYLICEQNTSSSKIEVHKWNPGLQSWAWHAITNMPAVNPANNTVVAGDIDGDRRDELILVAYNTTGSSKVEFHIWNPGLWSWRTHIASNQTEINQNNAKVEFADIDGNGVDEPVLTAFAGTGSGKIEFHVWNQGYYSWRDHIASNQPTP